MKPTSTRNISLSCLRILLTLLFLVVITPQLIAQCTTTNFSRTDYSSGGAISRSVAIGDFNKDGSPDLVVANFNSNNASVWLNNGAGAFTLAGNLTFTAGSGPISIAVADFNKDGNPDVATANYNTNTVSVFFGNGDGTFQLPADYPAGTNPQGIAVGDLNGDTYPDIVTANTGSNSITVLLNNGSGGFGAPVPYATGNAPVFVAIGDFNNDGSPDLAVTDVNSSPATVSIFLNNGSGVFSANGTPATGVSPWGVAAADLNSDGKMDLVVTDYNGSAVSVLLGNGDGTFQTQSIYTTGNGPKSVAIGDLNGDGKLDLAVGNESDNTVSVLLGNGNGTFQTQQTFPGFSPEFVVIGDFNADGKLDMATADVTSSNLSVFLNTCSPPASATISGDQTICSGGVATLTFSATGAGLATITYQDVYNGVLQAGVYTVTGAANGSAFSSTVNNLAAGTHTFTIVSVQDANGTTQGGNGTATVVVNQTPTATFAGTPSQTICTGAGTTSLPVNISGGTGVYTLTYTNAGTTTSVTVSGNTYSIPSPPTPGTYTYTLQSVQDQNTGCSSISSGTGTITVNQTPTATFAGTPSQTTCTGAGTTSLTVNIIGGTGVYTLTYLNGGTVTSVAVNGNTYTITSPVNAGVYTYTLQSVQDQNTGCTSTLSGTGTITVNQTPAVMLTPTMQIVCTPGVASVTGIITGGSGAYSITYTAASGGLTTTTSGYPAVPTATGGVFTITQVLPGTYTYTVTQVDDLTTGCSTNTASNPATVVINQTPAAAFAGTPSQTICTGAGTTSLTVNIIGGTGVYTLTYLNGGTVTSVAVNGNTYTITSPVNAGVYTYTLQSVQDQNTGCSSALSGTGTITVNQTPSVRLTPTMQIVCTPGVASVTGIITGGSGAYSITYTAASGGVTTTTSGYPAVPTATGGVFTITQVLPGTYTYTVTQVVDLATGCSTNTASNPATVVINQTPAAAFAGTPSQTICTGAGTTSLTVNIIGGTGVYTLTYLNGGTVTSVAVNGNTYTITSPVNAGVYTYTLQTVQDQSTGCTSALSGTGTITVNQTPTATFAGTPSQTTCTGSTTSLTVNITGGTGVYTLTYTDAGTSTSVTVNGNTYYINSPTNAGTYTYTLQSVQDRNTGCSSTSSGTGTITVNNTCTAAATISGDQTICSGGVATLTFTATGNGTATVTYHDVYNGAQAGVYTVTGATNGSAFTSTVNNLAAGTHTFTIISVQDANGTTNNGSGSATVIVNQTPTAAFAGTPSQTICTGAGTTSLTVNITGGSGVYTLTYTNAGTSTSVTVNGNTYTITSPVNAGVYTYTLQSVQDRNTGCSSTSTGTGTITVNQTPTATLAPPAQTICNGSTTQIIVSIVGGTGAYTLTYTEIGPGGTTTATTVPVNGNVYTITAPSTPTIAGTYTYTVTSVQDRNTLCTGAGTNSATVIVLPVFTVSSVAAQNPILCYGNTTTLTTTPTGGVGTVTYILTGAAGPVTNTVAAPGNAVFSNLPAGTYTVTAINGNPQACVATSTIVITQLQQVDATVQAFEVTCHGAANGKVYITGITGGTPPYQASIDGMNYIPINGSPLTPAFSGLAPSTFNLYMRDANGCTRVLALITITEPPVLAATVSQTSVICNNGTVTLTVNPSGGTPGMTTQGGTGSYTYTMDGGPQQFTNAFTTGAGTHTFTVTDAAGCVTTTSVTVPNSAAINYIYAVVVSATCYNGLTGQIGVSATGGTGIITYILAKPGGGTSTLTGAQGGVVTFTGLPAGTYTVTATNSNGCSTVTTQTVTQPQRVMPPGTSNGAPDLLLNVVLSASSFTTNAACITATYTVSIKNNGGANIAAQGVIVRVTKLSDVYTLTMDPSSAAMWTEIANTNGYKEFQLNPGYELTCTGAGISLMVRECRNGDPTKTTGAPGVGSVRMPGSTQDTNTFDNVRASVFQAQ